VLIWAHSCSTDGYTGSLKYINYAINLKNNFFIIKLKKIIRIKYINYLNISICNARTIKLVTKHGRVNWYTRAMFLLNLTMAPSSSKHETHLCHVWHISDVFLTEPPNCFQHDSNSKSYDPSHFQIIKFSIVQNVEYQM
jgi:hypothetical protein